MKKCIRRIKKIIKNPLWFFSWLSLKKMQKQGNSIPDKEYIEKMFKINMGYKLNLDNPTTFNEKLNYLKLFDRKDQYTIMVDKHAVKKFVSDIIGEEFIAKEYGVFNKTEEIDLSLLPNQFVLKTTHGCGGMLIVKDKNSFSLEEASAVLDPFLNHNYYFSCREWPYKNVPPKIIAEEFLRDDRFEVLPVYKFFCFNGDPFLLQAIQNDKHDDETIDYFDMSWNDLHIKQNFPNSKRPLNKPASFEKMKQLCKELSKGIPFVRCDFYDVNGKPYFSEYTFYSDAGFERFHPKKWDKILGEKIKLPVEKTLKD